MKRPSEETFQALKATHGDVLEFELPDAEQPEFGFCALLLPFTSATCNRYVDDGVVSIDDASDRLLVRHVLWPSPAEVQAEKRRNARLGKRVGDALCEDAGLPLTSPAKTTSDRLTAATPPGVLAQAGLDAAKATELLAAHPSSRLQILTISDSLGSVIFACVLSEPSQTELGLLRDAQEKRKGYAAACLSAARACVVWSRDDLDGAFSRFPAIPTLVIVGELNQIGADHAGRRFRRR